MVMKKKSAIDVIRNMLESFGHDTSNLSDEEIEKGADRFGKSLSQLGVSANDAMNAMVRLSKI